MIETPSGKSLLRFPNRVTTACCATGRFLVKLSRGISYRIRHYYRRYFRHFNYVYVHRGPFLPEHRPDCTFTCFKRFADVPASVREAIVASNGPRALEMDEQEMQAHAVMWVASMSGQAASILFTRSAEHFQQWFVPLEASDIVVFRVKTFPQFRGQGLAPSLIRYAIQAGCYNCGDAYTDVRMYNHPSIRSIEKAGFTRIKMAKPISRKSALGLP